ncbi:MAG: sigma-70 family RNA polymerase sigma factor [Candidatus Binatus sp.]|uniref:RNA polymerase sigma factor n=1 Tax=Candidatus Binatus sp. TaxID=2811406 RepID=UPI003BB091E1
MAATSLEWFLENYRDPIDRLFSVSNATAWHVSRSSFAGALWRSFDRRFSTDAITLTRTEGIRFLDSLHVADLALAIGCRDGDADAWRHLVLTYRAPVDAFARTVLGNSSRASEIADSLWADLYGLRSSDGARRSPLEHYGGRSSLMSWMRVVVTRLEADQWRATRRTEALDEERDGNSAVFENGTASPDPDRTKLISALERSLNEALNALSADDRLRLSYYYVHDLTLAQTAALIGEHESSASRNLARARTAIRDHVTRTLRREYRFSDDQIEQCFEYATGDWPFDLGSVLALGK